MSNPDDTVFLRYLAILACTAAVALRAQTAPALTVPPATATPAAATDTRRPLGAVIALPLPGGPPAADKPIQLGALRVSGDVFDETMDPTGMDAPEAERSESPFSNDLIMAETADDNLLDDIGAELSAINSVPAMDAAAGVNRVNLKGFPTPRQRNGFTQIGMPEILNTSGSESIMGPLTPVVGRAAPGGIHNTLTARPRGRKYSRLDFAMTSHATQSASGEYTGQLVPKRSWDRVALSWDQKSGPEPYTYSRHRAYDGAIIWKFNRAWSSMLQFDYDERASNAASGILEYRPTASAKIVEPYRPLAYFNLYGPNAGFRKRTASMVIQVEGQLARHVSVRASVQALQRSLDQDSWTSGQYLLDTKKIGGTREPQHTEQPFSGWTGQVDMTTRFHFWRADHKITLAVDSTQTDYERVQRALTTADRAAQPLDIRVFDPAAPNYERPAYSTARYARFITNRAELNTYSGIFISDRTAFMKGRLVMTAGVRKDFVTIDVTDRRVGAALPHVHDKTGEISSHLGANYILVPGRILGFANVSTAFEPSSRVDARTGRVQGNETTLGYELGAKGLFFQRRLALIGMGFAYFNQNISRRNPRYDDPIFDANQTQPQLVAAGEERFTGGALEGRFKVSEACSFSGRLTYNQALTTRSPDLPEEIGRALTRFPRLTGSLSGRYAFGTEGKKAGLSMGTALTHVSSTVASYETATHAYQQYPSYTLASLSLSYRMKIGNYNHGITVSVRNALDRDLLAQVARVGAGREFALNYGVGW
ncbi:MAG: TonB-dependent receptor [Opitutaceae bacterium]|nr:TonB-dependent receptor [Opitutaceae bacterium]